MESECSIECGSGTKNKTRSKKIEERYGGICDGSPTVIETCIGECEGNKKTIINLTGRFKFLEILFLRLMIFVSQKSVKHARITICLCAVMQIVSIWLKNVTEKKIVLMELTNSTAVSIYHISP